MSYPYEGVPCVDPNDPNCGLSRQNTVVIIYVFSTFGLVLMVLLCMFYICHRYGQRLDREAQRNQQLARQVGVLGSPSFSGIAALLCSDQLNFLQDIENKLVPIKQACFIEQPDG